MKLVGKHIKAAKPQVETPKSFEWKGISLELPPDTQAKLEVHGDIPQYYVEPNRENLFANTYDEAVNKFIVEFDAVNDDSFAALGLTRSNI